MTEPLRFPDPTNPRRIYIIDELRVHAYTPEEIAAHEEISRTFGVPPTGWTHTLYARWHAEDEGLPRFGATLEEAFTHRWGTPEAQALARVKSMMLPEIEPERLDPNDDDDEFEEDEDEDGPTLTGLTGPAEEEP